MKCLSVWLVAMILGFPFSVRADSVTDATTRQEIERIDFLIQVAQSPYAVQDVRVGFTLDGFVDFLEPVFSTTLLKVPGEKMYVFFRGEGPLVVYASKSIDACVSEVLGLNEEIRGTPQMLKKEGVPFLFIIMTKPKDSEGSPVYSSPAIIST